MIPFPKKYGRQSRIGIHEREAEIKEYEVKSNGQYVLEASSKRKNIDGASILFI